MTTLDVSSSRFSDPSLISALLSGERFWPTEPHSLPESGLSEPFLEQLFCKTLLINGSLSGRNVATQCRLPFTIVEPVLVRLRARRLLVHSGASQLNDYVYSLTDEGRTAAQSWYADCAYVGPAPVPLNDYVISVEAQAICDEAIRRDDLMAAFHDVSVSSDMLDTLGPAVNSASGMFLYGAPGNGKSTLAQRVTSVFGQEIWLPHAIIDGREIMTVFDPAYHHVTAESADLDTHDQRWARVRRPTVVVGGELTMDSLEIGYDVTTNISEAPLQMKSNGGCLLIDDFGRQRVSPEELLNRWIIPLENRHDFLTLRTGKKIRVPFEQLVIFSTNLDPADLVDEAFLRRIPYRIEVRDPDEHEFHNLFQIAAEQAGCHYDPAAVDHLLNAYYKPSHHPLRRCHARDLLKQIRNYCIYNGLPLEMRTEYFDKVAQGFFTRVRTKQAFVAVERDSAASRC